MMINKTLLVMYIVNTILISDLRIDYLSNSKSAGLLIKSQYKMLLYNAYQSIKRNYFQVIIIFMYITACVYIDNRYIPYAIMSLLIIFITPSLLVLDNTIKLRLLVIVPLFGVVRIINVLIILALFTGVFIALTINPKFKSVYKPENTFSENNKFRLILNSLVFLFIIYLVINFNKQLLSIKIPIELVFFLFIMITLARIEGVLKNNRIILLKFRSRFYLNMIKRKKISMKLIPISVINQILKEIIVLIFSVIFSIYLKNNAIEGIVLIMAILLQILSVLDIIIFNDILQSSIIYANNVTRKILVMGIDMLIFQYLIYYLIQDQSIPKEQPQTIQLLKYLYAAIILLCIVIFCFRMWKAFILDREGTRNE